MSEIGNKTEVGLYIENLVASDGATYVNYVTMDGRKQH